jgi:hypothetical protein
MYMDTDKRTAKCLRCGRTLRAASSVKRQYGRGCRAIIRAASPAEAVKGFAQRQIDAARELIEDGGLIPTSRPGVFRAVSSDGERSYLTHSETCACDSGRKRLTACTCKHSLGVRILMATGKA